MIESITGTAVGVFLAWLFIQMAKIIAHIGSAEDKNSKIDLKLATNRDLLAELKDIVDTEVSSVMKLAPYSETATQLVEIVGNRIFKEIAVRVDRSDKSEGA